jgi:riboflavin synthase
MFTGLVQTIATFTRVDPEHVQVDCTGPHQDRILTGLEIGDSVAVDGVCLTVTKILATGFVAVVSPETLRRSTLGTSQGKVNLETSLRVGSKLGGHFVTGHVDGIGYLKSSQATATSWEMIFTTDGESTARYIIPKGSIAINGISLTIADCDPDGRWFMVAVIPHTYSATNLCTLQSGSIVNLEGDILGKYVERFLRPGNTVDRAVDSAISPAFLAEHGYL